MKEYISKKIAKQMEASSWIRKMFETGAELKQKYGAENVFDFSLGNPDVPPPEIFFDVYSKKASEKNFRNHSYMPNAGYPDVRKKLGDHLTQIHNKNVTADNLIITCGAAGAINIILKSILNNDDEVILIEPFFAEYIFYVDNHNAKHIIANSEENFDLNIENIEKVITEKTRAIIINSPNNPTGKIYSEENLIKLSNLLTKYSEKFNHPIYILSDEPYRNIVYDNITVPSILNIYPDSIIAHSYSKELSLAGERIGYVLINPDCEGKSELFNAIVMCNRICGFVNAPATMQRVIGEIINKDNNSVDVGIYENRRNLFYDFLIKTGYKVYKPEGAFYFFVKSPIEDDVAFVNKLLEEKILVVPGRGFGRSGYFRISYCVNENIIKGSFSGFEKCLTK
jgi:aspartate aminotransferase